MNIPNPLPTNYHLEIQCHGKRFYGIIRSSFRKGGKVCHSEHGRLKGLPLERLKIIQASFRGGAQAPSEVSDVRVLCSKEYGASAALLSLVRELGLDAAIYSRKEGWREDCLAMIVGRVLYAGSKLSLSHIWAESALWELCGTKGAVDVESHCYEAMDRLLERQKSIQKALAKKHLSNGKMVLYDITSSYFEGQYEESDIVAFGYNRDGKRGHEQMVVGVLCSDQGCPVGVEVFRGNTQDAKTVPAKVEEIRNQYGLTDVVFVGDRGMVTRANAEKLSGEQGIRTISALTHRDIVGLLEKKVIQLELFDEKKVAEVVDPENPSKRYCLCLNPQSRKREQQTRRSLIKAVTEQLEKIAKSKRVATTEKLSARVGKLLGKYPMGKFIDWRIEEGRLIWSLLEEKVSQEECLDGCYIIVSDVPAKDMNKDELVSGYKQLQEVEKAIRNMKTVSIEMRPVYHKTDDRIRCHVFICMLSYYLQWHLTQRLRPLFDGDGHGKNRRWTIEHVIETLKAIRQETVLINGVEFYRTTELTSDQKRITDLLKQAA